MRCWEARQKLNQLSFEKKVIAEDQNLVNHLQSCQQCAELITAEQELQRDLHLAAADDTGETLSWQQLQRQVEQKAAAQTNSQFREIRFMAHFSNFYKKRPKLGLTVTVLAVFLLLSIVVPFKYNKTVGYEVAFAGVARDIALDSERISKLLDKLGIKDAAVDVSGCEATCNLKISELKTPDDAKLLVAAFGKLDNVVILDKIHEQHQTESGNIFKKIQFDIQSGHEVHDVAFFSEDADGNIHKILVERLGENPEEELMFWVSGDSNHADMHHFDPNTNEFFFFSEDGTSTMDIQASNNNDGTTTIIVNHGTPEEQVITIPDGPPSDETIQMLEDMGLTVHDLNFTPFGNEADNDKLHNIIELKQNDDLTADNSDDIDALAKNTSELPEGFILHQNYPNPFNPTTTISFEIPASQHVSVEIININGQQVKVLLDEVVGAGHHEIIWDATNASGSKVASGVYLYKLSTRDDVSVKKMTLMK